MSSSVIPPPHAPGAMRLDDAVRRLRAEPAFADLVRDAYLGRDVADSARRFAESGEFAEVRALLGAALHGAVVADLGAGTGIASHAFLAYGASRAVALEPDASDEVGQGAIRRLPGAEAIEIVAAYAERLPLADESADIVYARQVLHHTRDLAAALRECARVLRPGGIFLACREHVVDDDAELQRFLAEHPVHRLAGGENAYSLAQYERAIVDAGLQLERTLGAWDSVINAFPAVRSADELRELPRTRLRAHFGALGAAAARVPPVVALVRRRLQRPNPGRMYSFLARKHG
jgi:SAM-dependent methyltransferase